MATVVIAKLSQCQYNGRWWRQGATSEWQCGRGRGREQRLYPKGHAHWWRQKIANWRALRKSFWRRFHRWRLASEVHSRNLFYIIKLRPIRPAVAVLNTNEQSPSSHPTTDTYRATTRALTWRSGSSKSSDFHLDTGRFVCAFYFRRLIALYVYKRQLKAEMTPR